MSLQADPDWWKALFDDIYLVTDARSVCDDAVTAREVDLIRRLLPIHPGHRILDLCGGHGRHSIAFCKTGHRDCILLDYSDHLIRRAKQVADHNGYPIAVVRGDARMTGLAADSVDHVLIMGNSLGYIPDPAADRQIVHEAHRLLHPGGWLLLDITDGNAVRDRFTPMGWHEIDDDTVVCRRRELSGNQVTAREMVLSKSGGLVRDCTYAVRLYDADGIRALLEAAGFEHIRIHSDFSPHQHPGDYGFMNHRMIATGRK